MFSKFFFLKVVKSRDCMIKSQIPFLWITNLIIWQNHTLAWRKFRDCEKFLPMSACRMTWVDTFRKYINLPFDRSYLICLFICLAHLYCLCDFLSVFLSFPLFLYLFILCSFALFIDLFMYPETTWELFHLWFFAHKQSMRWAWWHG